MAVVGAGTDAASLNAEACKLAQAWASAADAAVKLAAFTDRLDIAGLQDAGFSSTQDATDFKAAADYLKTVAQVWQGAAAVTPAFNFSDALSRFVGPDPEGLYRA